MLKKKEITIQNSVTLRGKNMFIWWIFLAVILFIPWAITDKITEDERKHPGLFSPFIGFYLLKKYKKKNDMKYLILFVIDYLMLICASVMIILWI